MTTAITPQRAVSLSEVTSSADGSQQAPPLDDQMRRALKDQGFSDSQIAEVDAAIASGITVDELQARFAPMQQNASISKMLLQGGAMFGGLAAFSAFLGTKGSRLTAMGMPQLSVANRVGLISGAGAGTMLGVLGVAGTLAVSDKLKQAGVSEPVAYGIGFGTGMAVFGGGHALLSRGGGDAAAATRAVSSLTPIKGFAAAGLGTAVKTGGMVSAAIVGLGGVMANGKALGEATGLGEQGGVAVLGTPVAAAGLFAFHRLSKTSAAGATGRMLVGSVAMGAGAAALMGGLVASRDFLADHVESQAARAGIGIGVAATGVIALTKGVLPRTMPNSTGRMAGIALLGGLAVMGLSAGLLPDTRPKT